MKTEVVLKFRAQFPDEHSKMFNENRGCIEMNKAEEALERSGSLMKTEVVLKYRLSVRKI